MAKQPKSSRAPFQVLVLPFWMENDGSVQYCLFRRKDAGYWQGIAGGGENGESPAEAARREASEEAGIDSSAAMFGLDSMSSIPVANISGFLWGDEVILVTEYCFGVRVTNLNIALSKEHTECKWVPYEEAAAMLKWDSNRTALWELNHRLTRLPHTLVKLT